MPKGVRLILGAGHGGSGRGRESKRDVSPAGGEEGMAHRFVY